MKPVGKRLQLLCKCMMSVCLLLTGCSLRRSPQTNRLQVPVLFDTRAADLRDNEQKSAVFNQIEVGALTSFDTKSKVQTIRNILSMLPSKPVIRPSSDVHLYLPHISEDVVRKLFGTIDSRHNRSLPSDAPSSIVKWARDEKTLADAAELMFSDNYETVVDPTLAMRPFKTGHIAPDPETSEAFLVTEQITARRMSLLLPRGTPEEVVLRLRSEIPCECSLTVRMLDGRWQLSSELSYPRPISVGFIVLHTHHSKPHFVGVQETPPYLAIRLGWVESLPTPTDFWKSVPPGRAVSVDQARAFLITVLENNPLSPGVEFRMPQGYAVLTPKELLQGKDSSVPDYDHRFQIEHHGLWSVLCRAWNCSTGTVREMVLVVGRETPYSGPSPKVSLNDQIRADLMKSAGPIGIDEKTGSTCYALVYVYDRHWDGSLDFYSLDAHGVRARQHLVDSQLTGVLKCKP